MRSTLFILLCVLMSVTIGCKRPDDASQAQPAAADSAALGPGDSIPPSQPLNEPAGGAAAASAAPVAPAPPAVAINTEPINDEEADYFYDDLAPYGQWVQVPDYGPCWQPANVAVDWCPYTVGSWVYTNDYGWYWASDEPFGWCTYHYGRWADLPGEGWCWVPGRVWGPAWVVWRSGDGLCGWAPLPPARAGLSINLAVASIQPWEFRFCDERFLADPHVRDHFEPITRNVTLIDQTRDATRFERSGDHFINRGVDVAEVEKVRGSAIPRLAVRDATDARGALVRGQEVAAFRPKLPPRQAVAGRTESRFEPQAPSAAIQAGDNGREEQWNTYYRNQQAEMDARHQQELRQPPPGRTPEQIQAAQQRERQAVAQQQQFRTQNGPAAPRVVRRSAGGPAANRPH